MLDVSSLVRVPVPLVDKDQPISWALDLMDKNRLSALAVVDDDVLVGLLTVRDLLDRIWSERVRSVTLTNLYVSSAMKINVPHVSVDSDLTYACRVMVENDLPAIPVMDGDSLLGLLVEEDLPRVLLNSNASAERLIQRNFVSVKVSDSLLHAKMLMLNNGFEFLPVFSGEGRFLGIISDWNVIRLLRVIQEKVSSKYRSSRIRGLMVSDALKPSVPTFMEVSSVARISKVFVESDVRGVVIMDRGGEVSGIVQPKSFVSYIASGVVSLDVD